jgi:hypothetical protein
MKEDVISEMIEIYFQTLLTIFYCLSCAASEAEKLQI